MDAVITSHKPLAQAGPKKKWLHSIHGGAMQPPVVSIRADQLVPVPSRIVVVAPHPDDEMLALGGTFAALTQAGCEVCIYAVTDGEASHPHSSRWSAAALRAHRPLETLHALERLGLDATVVRLCLPDGGVRAHEKSLAAALVLHPDDTVFVPWRHDGHADHEACARAALAAARNVGARCIEFPVWALVPGHPAYDRLQGRALRRVEVPADILYAKSRAVEAYISQLEPDGAQAPVLSRAALDVWCSASEWVMA